MIAFGRLFIAFVFLSLGSAEAESPSLEEARLLLRHVVELYRSGKTSEALPFAQRSLELREKELGSTDILVAESLNAVGFLHQDRGEFTQAEAHYRRALSIASAHQPPDRLFSTCLNNLAMLYKDQGRYPEVEPLYRRALEFA